MTCTRRKLLRTSLALTGSVVLSPTAGCRRENQQQASTKGATATKANSTALPTEPAYLQLERNGQLALREIALHDILKKCQLCPRKCEIDRSAGEHKTCHGADKLRVHSTGPHYGEEKPLVGKRGSGTVFFSYCNLRCCFCQNWEIAHRGDGSDVGHRTLAAAMLELQRRGCHNVNLVTPTHMVPHIVSALRIAITQGLRLPLVYNTGGYDSVRTIELLDGIVDIYMPDFKFQSSQVAHRFCEEASDYPLAARTAIKEMHRQVGVLRTDTQGVAQRGLLFRHLFMPNNLAGTDRFVKWVARELSPDSYVNLMSQYRPEYLASTYPEIDRRLTPFEWNKAVGWAKSAGLTNLDRDI